MKPVCYSTGVATMWQIYDDRWVKCLKMLSHINFSKYELDFFHNFGGNSWSIIESRSISLVEADNRAWWLFILSEKSVSGAYIRGITSHILALRFISCVNLRYGGFIVTQ